MRATELHTDPALTLAVRCCYVREAHPTQEWPKSPRVTCLFGIKPRSDWPKVRTQQPITTHYAPNGVCQWRIQNASEFSEL
ncbi:hypothetical protein T265_04633 [Opisthorchis viverrini]|uniref:Uncharacterized protein n=1 Tax=Opisthorchis viverrini TaxID=6198 RepID=A0A074ZZ52_OPIVI|nr:hypothetical protein T265_04633 [Opisthorchis viverrini]KER28590.1 hypothetical protein T265_04633 [Opisthorchis viverrini]